MANRATSNREFLQLAHVYDPVKHCVAGWYASEKLDGMRALWDGGLTRGVYASNIPFANTVKDYRLKSQPVATGLWSRYGKVIYAPDYFLDRLPEGVCLDGELYIGPGQFQEVMSVVKQFNPDPRWASVKYRVFDIPSYGKLFVDGKINNPQFKKEMRLMDNFGKYPKGFNVDTGKCFDSIVEQLDNYTNGVVLPVWQERLPMSTDSAQDRMNELMDTILANGGEGLILRKPESIWYPKRSHDLLKVKPENDSEGTVIGYVWGRGKYENLMGALVVKWGGVTFELSGFTDNERVLLDSLTDERATGVPGTKVDCTKVYSSNFPLVSRITFKFRELTDAGVPKEARYFRK